MEKILGFLAASLEVTHHLEFYLLWTQKLLLLHGTKLKARSGTLLPTVQFLQKGLQRHLDTISKLCDWNRYNLCFALALSQQRGLKRPLEPGSEEKMEEDEEEDNLCLMGTVDGDDGDSEDGLLA